MKNTKLIILYLLSLVLLLPMISCTQKTYAADTIGDFFSDVISMSDDGFKFQNIDWLSNQDSIEDKVPDTIYNIELNRLETDKNITTNIDSKTLYYLQEDQFVTGEYIIITNTESDFKMFLAEVKKQAKEFFKNQQPMDNSLEDLDFEHPVSWESENKSYFRIRCFEHEQEGIFTISLIVEL